MSKRHHRTFACALAMTIGAALGASAPPIHAYESPVHVFSIDDVMGGFDGSTFGTEEEYPTGTSIICGVEGGSACPPEFEIPIPDKSGVDLYPVDSEFGFYVVDFLGAQGKIRDGDYLEGFVGNIEDGETVIGIQVSNAATEKYKVKPPLGTWCQGLGGTSVKCETEHYTVMEHVLSCYETIPYFFVEDPLALPPATQAVISTPIIDGQPPLLTFDCANAPLDDNTLILVGGAPTDRLTDATPCEDVNDPEGCQMFPNDKTDMQNNIALSTDYSVQLKDDGKPLYGWGGLHKRPNDIRMYARLVLPDAWKAPGAPDYVVTRAELVINHWITNNPNDQLRPEDLENEAATGRKPSYRIDDLGRWRSTVPCYEGDGDLIDTEEGGIDSTFIGIGTVLKNTPYALDPLVAPGDDPPLATPPYSTPPYAFSSDLQGGFTNAFYTTINRDPFEWSYDQNPDPLVQDFIGSEFPLTEAEMLAGGLELVSGPRWRLKPNKFGQDLPGLEIPLEECSPPPFQSDNIKYVVGTPVTTVINLLDWEKIEVGPLATSKGWVDLTVIPDPEVEGRCMLQSNPNVTIVNVGDGTCLVNEGEPPITSNGLPMTPDFDLAVYVKGDRKSTAVYNARLIIEYEGEVPEPPTDFDLALTALDVPGRVLLGASSSATVVVTNSGPANVSGAVVTLTGVTNRGDTISVTPDSETLDLLASGDSETVPFKWTAPGGKPATISWTAVVTPDGDTNPATAQTKVRRN